MLRLKGRQRSAGRSYRELSTAGLRSTSQRETILDIIRRREGHLDADEIYRRARRKEPRISLSTVYRSLQKFKELGIVEEYHFDEDHHHYEAKSSSQHHHLVCAGCGRVVEFDYDLPRRIADEVPEARGFKIAGGELRLTGFCSDCAGKRK